MLLISYYVIGGYDESGVALDSGERYDILRNGWSDIAPMSSAREGVAVAVVNNVLYAIGGYDIRSTFNTVERYSPDEDRWSLVASMSVPRFYHCAAVVGNIIYVMGGYRGRRYMNSVESYDPDSDSWTTVANMGVSRADAGVATHDGLLYMIGGSNDGNLSSVEVYDTKCNVWSELGSNMSTGKYGLAAVVIDKPK